MVGVTNLSRESGFSRQVAQNAQCLLSIEELRQRSAVGSPDSASMVVTYREVVIPTPDD